MQKISNILIASGGILTGTSFFLNTFFYTVDAGERAVMFDKAFGGVKSSVYGEGMHFYIPFA
jgi:prohibitin 1